MIKLLNNYRTRMLLIVCLLVLVTLACTTVTRNLPAGLPLSADPVGNGLIGYLGADGNVYMIDENGEELTAITDDAQAPSFSNNFRLYQFPTWSPDGRHLAFMSIEADDTSRVHRLLVANRETGELSDIFSHEDDQLIYLYWSPDNESISFLTTGDTAPNLNLRLAFLNGDESIILDQGQPYYWSWNPDGTQFFIHEGGSTSVNPDARLALFSLGDRTLQRFDLAPGNFLAPSWSPDGDRLLAAVQGEEQNSLKLLALDGSSRGTITDFKASMAFSWSPDGKWIATRPTNPESNGLFGPLHILSSTSPDVSLNTPEETVLAYFWAPDSQKIAYFTLETGEGINSLISSTRQEGEHFQLSLKLLLTASGTRHHIATFQPTDDFLAIIPFFDQYHHSATIWSPDSSKLVYTSLDQQQVPHLHIVGENGRVTLRQIAEGTLAFWSWR